MRSGISDELGQLLAEQDDNALHKPLTQTEQAALYRELKTLPAEDAARRQRAPRFTGTGDNPRSHGAATVAAPSTPTVIRVPAMPPDTIRTFPFCTALVLLRSAPPIIARMQAWISRRDAARRRKDRAHTEALLRYRL